MMDEYKLLKNNVREEKRRTALDYKEIVLVITTATDN